MFNNPRMHLVRHLLIVVRVDNVCGSNEEGNEPAGLLILNARGEDYCLGADRLQSIARRTRQNLSVLPVLVFNRWIALFGDGMQRSNCVPRIFGLLK